MIHLNQTMLPDDLTSHFLLFYIILIYQQKMIQPISIRHQYTGCK